ncbi:MAG: hypothetical protein ACXVGA_08565 [Mycobacteriaceae bacterium]
MTRPDARPQTGHRIASASRFIAADRDLLPSLLIAMMTTSILYVRCSDSDPPLSPIVAAARSVDDFLGVGHGPAAR